MMWWFVALFAGLTGVAVVEHLHGNPTAINGIIGAGLGTAVFMVCAILDR